MCSVARACRVSCFRKVADVSTRCRVQKPRKVAVRLFNQACSGVLKQHVVEVYWFGVLGFGAFEV